MRISKTRDYAILTGDIVASSRLSPSDRREVPTAISRSSTALRRVFKNYVPVPVTLSRGDSWQMLVTDTNQALRIGLFFRASLRGGPKSPGLDTRMAIAVGRIDFIPGDRIAEGDGPAYRLSGSALESMHKRENMHLVFPSHPAEKALSTVVCLLDGIVSRWSDKRARAVCGALRGWSQEKIATRSWDEPISQQAVAQLLDRAGWNYIERALKYYEDVVPESTTP